MLKKYKYNQKLITIIILLFIISIISIYSSQIYLSKTLGNLSIKQTLWYLVGTVLTIIILKLDNSFFYEKALPIYILNILMLFFLLIFAPNINGSKCWFIIPKLGSIQPSEFMKISLIIIEAKIIDKYHSKRKEKKTKDELILIIKLFITFLIPTILTFLEPDTGACIIYLLITITLLFTSNINFKWFKYLIIITIIGLTTFLFLYFYKQETFIKLLGTSFFYRMDRIINWNNKKGMQLENSIISISTSKLLGHGFNKAPIYLPEAGTDFIFTIFTSCFGLLGSIILITIITILDITLISSSIKSNNYFNKYLLIGISTILIYQQIQNISMTIGLLPIIGITLPFISYGGSSIISYMISFGIILNSTKEKRLI